MDQRVFYFTTGWSQLKGKTMIRQLLSNIPIFVSVFNSLKYGLQSRQVVLHTFILLLLWVGFPIIVFLIFSNIYNFNMCWSICQLRDFITSKCFRSKMPTQKSTILRFLYLPSLEILCIKFTLKSIWHSFILHLPRLVANLKNNLRS